MGVGPDGEGADGVGVGPDGEGADGVGVGPDGDGSDGDGRDGLLGVGEGLLDVGPDGDGREEAGRLYESSPYVSPYSSTPCLTACPTWPDAAARDSSCCIRSLRSERRSTSSAFSASMTSSAGAAASSRPLRRRKAAMSSAGTANPLSSMCQPLRRLPRSPVRAAAMSWKFSAGVPSFIAVISPVETSFEPTMSTSCPADGRDSPGSPPAGSSPGTCIRWPPVILDAAPSSSPRFVA